VENKNHKRGFYSDAIAAIKGELAINKVIIALESLKKLKVVKNFGETDSFSNDDCNGIDVIIYPFWNGKICLQVKSSFNFKDKSRYNRRGIFYLAIPPKMEVYGVESRISKMLARAYERKMRKKDKKAKSFF